MSWVTDADGAQQLTLKKVRGSGDVKYAAEDILWFRFTPNEEVSFGAIADGVFVVVVIQLCVVANDWKPSIHFITLRSQNVVYALNTLNFDWKLSTSGNYSVELLLDSDSVRNERRLLATTKSVTLTDKQCEDIVTHLRVLFKMRNAQAVRDIVVQFYHIEEDSGVRDRSDTPFEYEKLWENDAVTHAVAVYKRMVNILHRESISVNDSIDEFREFMQDEFSHSAWYLPIVNGVVVHWPVAEAPVAATVVNAPVPAAAVANTTTTTTTTTLTPTATAPFPSRVHRQVQAVIGAPKRPIAVISPPDDMTSSTTTTTMITSRSSSQVPVTDTALIAATTIASMADDTSEQRVPKRHKASATLMAALEKAQSNIPALLATGR